MHTVTLDFDNPLRAVVFRAKLLVPVSVPLWCAAGCAFAGATAKDSPQRSVMHRLRTGLPILIVAAALLLSLTAAPTALAGERDEDHRVKIKNEGTVKGR